VTHLRLLKKPQCGWKQSSLGKLNSMGNIITLKGRTNKGKNRIREHGDQWVVMETTLTPSPPLPPVKSLKTGETRWLDSINFEFCLESKT
jgi:hypothetical protein